MMNKTNFSFRQIHLDFHNSPAIPDIGADWDADDFVATLRGAHVDSINLFAKCHHGMNYYPSKIGPVHPTLQFDLLGEQVEACHRADIRCPIYLSVGWEASAAERHPEWRQVDTQGRLIGGGPLEGTPWNWPWMCLNNTYADELLAQTQELLDLYQCDGFFYDIVMYDESACLCANCLQTMKRDGRDASNPAHRKAHTDEVARAFMTRASKLIRQSVPSAGIFYNSRWGLQFQRESDSYSQIEIESLPTGGWGYGFYPLWSRFARTLDKPMLGMTGRFHQSWADWGGLKHPDALRFECGGILAAGGAVCIGDQLHPRGRLNSTVYEVIGEALAEVKSVEQFCSLSRPVSQIGLLTLQEPSDRAELSEAAGALEGAGKMLLELHHQFDVLSTDHTDEQWSAYELLVVADSGTGRGDAEELASRLRAYVERGGKLLLVHDALVNPDNGDFYLAEEIGATYEGPASSAPDYFEILDPSLFNRVARPHFAYATYAHSTSKVMPHEGTQILAQARESYFNRTWEHYSSHSYTAPGPENADYPAAVQKENVIYVYAPIFSAYQQTGAAVLRALVGGLLRRLLSPLVTTNAPASAEISLSRQEEPARYLLHIVNYSPTRRAPGHIEVLDRPVALRDLEFQIVVTSPITSATMARTNESLPFTQENGVVSVSVPCVDLHDILILEISR